jgi:hypothetical protein
VTPAPDPPPDGPARGPEGTGASDAPHEPDVDELARTAGEAARRVSGTVAGVTFVGLHAVVGWLVLSLGLLAPIWAVLPLLALWAVVGVLGWRGRRRHPIVTMLLPLATAGLVLGLVAIGGELFGWTA